MIVMQCLLLYDCFMIVPIFPLLYDFIHYLSSYVCVCVCAYNECLVLLCIYQTVCCLVFSVLISLPYHDDHTLLWQLLAAVSLVCWMK